MKDTQTLVAPQANELLFLGDEIRTSLKHALTEKQASAASRVTDYDTLKRSEPAFKNPNQACTTSSPHLKHFGKIPQVKCIVALGGGRQQVVGDRVVDVKRSRHHVCGNLPSNSGRRVVTCRTKVGPDWYADPN